MRKIPEDIEQLDKKIAALRQKEAVIRHERKDADLVKASRIGLRIGAELLSAVIVGAALGYLIDEFFGSKPWGMVAFLFFGGVAGVLNVYRLAKKEDNQKEGV